LSAIDQRGHVESLEQPEEGGREGGREREGEGGREREVRRKEESS
jgi:hypothetical protein